MWEGGAGVGSQQGPGTCVHPSALPVSELTLSLVVHSRHSQVKK